MKVLQGLEPTSVFGFFEDICNIPHISYHEKELSDYCANFAKKGIYPLDVKNATIQAIKEEKPYMKLSLLIMR